MMITRKSSQWCYNYIYCPIIAHNQTNVQGIWCVLLEIRIKHCLHHCIISLVRFRYIYIFYFSSVYDKWAKYWAYI